MRERGLTQTWRAKQQHVVERLLARPRRRNENLELAPHGILTHVVGQARRPQSLKLSSFFGHYRDSGNKSVSLNHKIDSHQLPLSPASRERARGEGFLL